MLGIFEQEIEHYLLLVVIQARPLEHAGGDAQPLLFGELAWVAWAVAHRATLVVDFFRWRQGCGGFFPQHRGAIELEKRIVKLDVALGDLGRVKGFGAARIGIGAFADGGDAGVGGGGLRQTAGATAGGQEIDQAIVAAPLAVQLRPGPFVQADHAGHDLVGHPCPDHQRAPCVVQLDQIAIANAVGLGILHADGQRLARLHGVALAQFFRVVQLRVQPPVGVGADHMHLALFGVAQVLAWLLPGRHGGHIGDGHLGDGGGIHLDLAAVGVQRVLFGVGAKIAMAHPLVCLGRHRNACHAIGPELLERGVFGGSAGRVGVFDVVHGGLALGEGIFHPKQLRQAAEDFKIIQRIVLRRDDLLHCIHLVDAVGAC